MLQDISITDLSESILSNVVNVQAVTYDDTSTAIGDADGWDIITIILSFFMHPNGNNVEGIAKIRYKTIYDEATSCAAKMAEYSIVQNMGLSDLKGSINPVL